MSENIEDPGVETPSPETPPEVNEVEQAARAQGWVPKEEWNGTGRWRDAESFLDRGELFNKIEAQRREIKELHRTQQAFAAHLDTTRKAAYQKAITDLRAEKVKAFEDGDAKAVVAAEEKMDALREQLRVEQAQPKPQIDSNAQAAFQAEFAAWSARNTWYAPSNRAMVDFADAEGRRLTAQGNLTGAEILKEVEAQVRREFPQKFANPNRERAGAVEGGGTRSKAKETYQLSDMERRTMQRLVKSGAITEEGYIADLKAVKGVK